MRNGSEGWTCSFFLPRGWKAGLGVRLVIRSVGWAIGLLLPQNWKLRWWAGAAGFIYLEAE